MAFTNKLSPSRWVAAYKPIIFKWASDYFPNNQAGEVGIAVTDVRYPTAAELLLYANLRADDILVVHGAITPGVWPMGQTIELDNTVRYDGVFLVAKEIDTTLTVIESEYQGDETGLTATISKYYNHYSMEAVVYMGADPNTPKQFKLVKGTDDLFTLDLSEYARSTFQDVFEVATPGLSVVTGAIPSGDKCITQGFEVLIHHRYDVPDADGVPVSTEDKKDEYSEGLFNVVNAVQPYEHYTKDEVIDLRWLDDLAAYQVTQTSPNTTRFLTYAPRATQVVRPGEDFFLCFLWTKGPGLAVKVHIETFDAAGGAVAVWNFNRTTPIGSGVLGVGPANMPSIVTTGVKTYTVRLLNSSSTAITETFTFTIDTNCSEVARRFFWLDPLGGVDQFTLTGREKPQNSVKRSVAERPNMPVTSELLGSGSSQRKVWKTELVRKFMVTSELIAPGTLYWLYGDLFPSANVRITRDGTLWTEVIIETDDHIGPSTRDQYERMRLEYSLGTDNVTQRR